MRLALAGVATHFYVYFVYIHPVAAGHWRDEGRILHKEAAQAEPAVPLDRLAIQGVSRLYIIQLVNLWTIGASLVALTVAALFTILLVLASRRATLRQVQVSLGEIAEQLKRLSAAGKPVHDARRESAGALLPQETVAKDLGLESDADCLGILADRIAAEHAAVFGHGFHVGGIGELPRQTIPADLGLDLRRSRFGKRRDHQNLPLAREPAAAGGLHRAEVDGRGGRVVPRQVGIGLGAGAIQAMPVARSPSPSTRICPRRRRCVRSAGPDRASRSPVLGW